MRGSRAAVSCLPPSAVRAGAHLRRLQVRDPRARGPTPLDNAGPSRVAPTAWGPGLSAATRTTAVSPAGCRSSRKQPRRPSILARGAWTPGVAHPARQVEVLLQRGELRGAARLPRRSGLRLGRLPLRGGRRPQRLRLAPRLSQLRRHRAGVWRGSGKKSHSLSAFQRPSPPPLLCPFKRLLLPAAALPCAAPAPTDE